MQSKMMIWGGTAIVGLSLILSACGGANTTDPGKTDPGKTDPGTFTPPAISGFTYVPADVTIKVGTEITLPGDPGHPLKGVTSEVDNPIPATSVAPVKVTFNKVGKFTYFCQFHGTSAGGMKGTVTVTN
jgi:plastocyanin